MPITSTPSLGSSINVNGGLVGPIPYWDSGRTVPSPQLGTVMFAVDGHSYIFAQASAAIASGARATITEPAMTMATDAAGIWQAPTVTGGVPINQYAWFKRFAI